MKKNTRNVLSVMLALCLTVSLFAFLPASALGAGVDFVPGDVNGDGEVNAADARLALRRAVGLETYEEGSRAFLACDVDYNGEVNAADARLILRAAVGLEELKAPESQSEYDILRSGSFYIDAVFEDGEEASPMKMAVDTNGDFYALADMDGLEMGFLVKEEKTLFGKEKKTYLVNPKTKTYTEFSRLLMSLMNLNPGDFADEVNELGFTDMPPLTEAESVSDGEYNGTPCKVYRMSQEYGTAVRVYMDGTKLLVMETLGSDGTLLQVMKINSITAGFPQLPPADYELTNIVNFITDLGLDL